MKFGSILKQYLDSTSPCKSLPGVNKFLCKLYIICSGRDNSKNLNSTSILHNF